MHLSVDYRITVTGLVLRPVIATSSPYPPVLLQWPAKAAVSQCGNLTTVQGGVEPSDPDPLTAMKRELKEEFGIHQATIHPLSHRRYRSEETRKEYVWFLVLCDDPVVLMPDRSEVAEAGWYYCPQMLMLGIKQMNHFKGVMYREVFEVACLQYPESFGEYVRLVERYRKRRREAQQRLAAERRIAS